jgi:hypothetical protein
MIYYALFAAVWLGILSYFVVREIRLPRARGRTG